MASQVSTAKHPILDKLESSYLRDDSPNFKAGDTVAVHYKIVEGDKLRVQVFRGVVIKQRRAGARSSFTEIGRASCRERVLIRWATEIYYKESSTYLTRGF